MSNKNNLLLLNSFFDRGDKDREDKLYIVLKNVETGEKKIVVEENPKIPIHYVKSDKHVPDYFMEYRDIDDLHKEEVSYRWREWSIARLLGYDSFVTDVRNKTLQKEQIFLDKRLFGADLNINDRVIMDYMDSMKEVDDKGNVEYPDSPPIDNIHLGFFDLEWDVKYSDSNDIFDPENPIYLMTYVDARFNECHTFYLKDSNYKKQKDLIDNPDRFERELRTEIKEYVRDVSGKSKKADEQFVKMAENRLDSITYNIVAYDDEKEMIEDFYKLIFHDKQPDFLYAFNTEADITQTMNRCDRLGINPADIFTLPGMDDYFWFNTRDQSFKPAEKRHNYDCVSYTKIMDMMITYYAIRGHKTYTQHSLEATARRELGVGKLDFSHITHSIVDLPYKDFKTTTSYNIIDTMVMMFVEDMTEDTTTLMSKRFITRTNYDRLFISMQIVMNAFYHIGERNGKILSNEVNKNLLKLTDQEVESLKENDMVTYNIIMAIKNGDTIEGGLCTDPNMVINEGAEVFDNIRNTKVHKSVIDVDAASMYPNNMITGNMSKSTLIGKITGVTGEYKKIIDNFNGTGNLLKITESGWDTIKSKKSKQESFKKKYDAIEYVGYKTDINGDLYIDVDLIMDIYEFGSFYKLLQICTGDTLDDVLFDKLKKDKVVSSKDHIYFRTILQMYVKDVTGGVGEKAMLGVIQRDLVSIGEVYFNLPGVLELESRLNNHKPKFKEGRNKLILEDNKKPLFEQTKENKKIIQILSKLDKIQLSKKDVEVDNFYNTNGLFLIDTEVKNRLSLHGRYIEYYLKSNRSLNEFFNMNRRAYVNRNGNSFPNIYKNQTKPKITPKVSDRDVVFQGEFDQSDIKNLRTTDLLTRRITFGDVTVNVTPRSIPVLDDLESIDVYIYKTEISDIYDVMFRIYVPIKSIKDELILDQYMRVLNY